MAASQTSSRLQLLQARFQQKQLQEKEQKLLQLYDQQQQRAHQVAQRGSAGSNGSNGSSHGSIVGPPAGKVRQMYDERRQTNVKGIDKSYPLEPLDARSKKHTSGKPVVAAKSTGARRNAAAPGVTKSRSVTRADVNSNVSSGSRTVVLTQRESFSSTRSTEEYHELNAGESVRQVNGHARNGHHQQHYEINIDEVIDNEAMERNRMLAKFRPIDIENQRRSFSGDIETEEFPAEMVLRDDKAASPPARKSSPTEAKAERFKNTNTRKSSTTLATAAPQTTTTTKKRSEPAIPTGANARQSTVMKTTKSASLKIKKLPRNKKAFENKMKSSVTQKAKPIKKKSKETMTEESKCSENEENLSKKFSSLKSTSLICEILRNHNRIEKTTDTTDMGKVKTIVTKIENTTKEIKTESNNAINSNQKTESIVINKSVTSTPSVSVTKKRPSLFDSDLCKMTKKEPIKVSRQDDQNTALKNIENEDKGDGLIHRGEPTSSLTIRENRESSVEHPTERQEITIADQTTIKAPSEKQHHEEEEEDDEKDDQVLQTDYKRFSGSCASNRVRRASFELKCLMFEQMQAASAAGNDKFTRRDSVESALRHFDSIGVDVTDFSESSKDGKKSILALNPACAQSNENSNNADCAPPESDYSTLRLCTRDSPEKEPGTQTTPRAGVKGFERHTSAWSMKTLKAGKPPQQLIAKASVTPVISRRIVSRKKLLLLPKKYFVSKKLLEARDSIELARVTVKPRMPSCRRKLNFNSSAGSLAEKVTQTTTVASTTTTTSEEAATPVQSQSFSSDNSGRVAQLKSVFLVLQISKTDDTFAPSTRIADSIPKRADSRASDSMQRKNIVPYPSSKSPDIEQRSSRLAAKTPSLKLLNRAGDSNDDAAQYASENGISTAARKSSLSAVDYSDSPADPRNQSFDDEKPVTPAPRTAATSSHSSTSSLGPSRNQQGPRTAAKAKSNAGAPAPAHRSSPAKAASNNDDSLTTCKICNRRFTTERITLHEQICSKTSQKKRKQFDAVTHRVKGTELEPFVQKPAKKQGKAAAAAAAKKASAATEEAAKSNWRRKHEDFINAIRSAKQMQAHLAAGGKLSDLPPPPPSDTSDYVQCPHCSRKFNQGAAERHIPKCENMQHNKPRAQPRSKR